MLIMTYRVGYTPPFGTRSFQTTLTLRSLSEAESLAMAREVLGTGEFPEQLKAALMEKAEGVPLFVEEVAKTLLDLGLLRRENGGLRFVTGAGDVSVPDTIQGIIMARLDRLGEDGKRMVQLASVIGRQFLVRLLERIAGLTGELEGLLGELQVAGDHLRARAASRAGVHLQARAHPGRRVQQPAQGAPPRAAPLGRERDPGSLS